MLADSRAYLQLVRFPLIFASWSDVLAGYFLALSVTGAGPSAGHVALMLMVTAFLNAGGMTLSDCFAYESAKEHGRARPLPVGLLSAHAGFAVGLILTLLAIACAVMMSAQTGLVSVLAALLLAVFAALTSTLPILGAINLAMTRGLFMIFGMACATPSGPLMGDARLWGPVAALFGYVFLVTQIASEESRLNRERILRLVGAVIVVFVVLNVLLYFPRLSRSDRELEVLMSVFVLGVVGRLLQLARRVMRDLTSESVQKLVVGAFVGAIVLNANFVAYTGHEGQTIGVLFLLLPSFILLRFFHILFPGTQTAMD